MAAAPQENNASGKPVFISVQIDLFKGPFIFTKCKIIEKTLNSINRLIRLGLMPLRLVLFRVIQKYIVQFTNLSIHGSLGTCTRPYY